MLHFACLTASTIMSTMAKLTLNNLVSMGQGSLSFLLSRWLYLSLPRTLVINNGCFQNYFLRRAAFILYLVALISENCLELYP